MPHCVDDSSFAHASHLGFEDLGEVEDLVGLAGLFAIAKPVRAVGGDRQESIDGKQLFLVIRLIQMFTKLTLSLQHILQLETAVFINLLLMLSISFWLVLRDQLTKRWVVVICHQPCVAQSSYLTDLHPAQPTRKQLRQP